MFNKRPNEAQPTNGDCKAPGEEFVAITLPDQAPAIAVYMLRWKHVGADRYIPVVGYTEQLEPAMVHIDAGGIVSLIKAWKLPDGRIALRNPNIGGVPAVVDYAKRVPRE